MAPQKGVFCVGEHFDLFGEVFELLGECLCFRFCLLADECLELQFIGRGFGIDV